VELYKSLNGVEDIVTCIPIAKQRLGNIPAQAYARNNRASIARQRVSKQAFSTVEVVFSAWSVQSCYKDVFDSIGGCPGAGIPNVLEENNS
jgi:hypothetical protein